MPMPGPKVISVEVCKSLAGHGNSCIQVYHSRPAEKNKPLCFELYLTKESYFKQLIFIAPPNKKAPHRHKRQKGRKSTKQEMTFSAPSVRSQLCLSSTHM